MTPAVEAKLPAAWTNPQVDSHWWRNSSLATSLKAAQAITRHHAKSFYFSSFPLPRHKKLAAFTVYAFCRWVDDLIDENEDAAGISREAVLATVNQLLDGGRRDLPFAAAFQRVTQEFGVPIEYYRDLVIGCCMDREAVKLGTFDELERYCYHVASVVGMVMCRIFGLKDVAAARHAFEMGIAMQLTNILRDVAEDFAKDRVYLPASELKAYELPADRLDTIDFRSKNWQRFMAFQIGRARDYYQRASAGLLFLPADGCRFTVALMGNVYGGILDEIEKAQNNVFEGRVYTSKRRKLALTAATWRQCRNLSAACA